MFNITQALFRVNQKLADLNLGRKSHAVDEYDLQGHLKTQNLAYKCAKDIAREMKPGWSEKQTAELMDTYLRDHGVKLFFHSSFAWFGERTRFDGIDRYRDFMPSKRILKEEDIFILDTAPIFDGYMADIGYTSCLIENPKMGESQTVLKICRDLLPKLFAEDISLADIYKRIDKVIEEHGFENRHQKYPYKVLGHKVYKIPMTQIPGLLRPFTLHAYLTLLSHGLPSELLGPYHEGKGKLKQGIWAIEPHIGGDRYGAKFEEILVVPENKKPYWLQPEIPWTK